MIYLKTIFAFPHEIKFLELSLREAFDYIDKFIVCEANRTHTGASKDFIFEKFWDCFSKKERQKIIYIKEDLSEKAVFSETNGHIIHDVNEKWIRGYFASQLKLNDNDIVFSVDADEIIYGQYYPKIIKKLRRPWRKAFVLPLWQFYYKINYLWENCDFVAPTVCRAKFYKQKYPANWRYEGKRFPERVGAHFSWCCSIDEMIAKLAVYSHHQDYGHLAKREILEAAVQNKIYPFDPNRDFQIKVLNIYEDKEYYPKEIYNMLDEFKELIG